MTRSETLSKIAGLIFLYFKFNFVRLFFSVLLRAFSLVFQAASIAILISLILTGMNENLLELLYFTTTLQMILFCILLLLFSILFQLYSKRWVNLSAFRFEKRLYDSGMLNDVTTIEFRPVIRILIGLVDSLIPIFFFFVVCILWVYNYFVLLFVLVVVFAISIILLFWSIRVISKSHGDNVNNLRAEAKTPQEVLYSTSSSSRPLFKMFMLPQYVSASIHFIVAVVLVVTLSTANLDNSSSQSLISQFLPVLTLLSLIQLSNVASFLVKVGIFFETILNVACKVSLSGKTD